MVYVKNEETPSSQWPFGKVIESYPDRDGISRFFKIRTARSVFDRPGVKLVLLVYVSADEDPRENKAENC